MNTRLASEIFNSNSFARHVESCLAVGKQPREPQTARELSAVLNHSDVRIRRYATRWKPAADVVERFPQLQPASTPSRLFDRLSVSASRLMGTRHVLVGGAA